MRIKQDNILRVHIVSPPVSAQSVLMMNYQEEKLRKQSDLYTTIKKNEISRD